MKEKQYDLAIAEWKKILDIDETQEAASRYIASAVREKMGGLYAEAKQAYENGRLRFAPAIITIRSLRTTRRTST